MTSPNRYLKLDFECFVKIITVFLNLIWRVIADIAARQECGEVTVQNIVTPNTASKSGSSSGGLSGAAAADDDDSKVDTSSSSDLTSHNSNSSTATGPNFGQLVCRKRKSPLIPVAETEIENTSQQNGTTEHTHSHSRGTGDSNDNDDDPILKKAKTFPSLDSALQDCSPLPSQSGDAALALKQHSDTNTDADHRQEDRHEAVESSGLISQTADSTNIIIKNDFGSEVLKVSFTEEMWSRLLVPPALTPDMLSLERHTNTDTDSERASYGVKYNFSLKDKATEAAVDAPEWLVPQVSILLYCTSLHCTALHCTVLSLQAPYSSLRLWKD